MPLIATQTLRLKVFPLLLLWVLWGLASISAAADQPLVNAFVLPPVAKNHGLIDYVYLWEDPSQQATLSDAEAALDRGEFRSSLGNLNKGFTDSAFWFYVLVENRQSLPRDLIIENDYPMLDALDVYCQVKDVHTNLMLGDHVSRSGRPILTRNYLIPLSLPGKESVGCFFRVVSSSNVALPISISDVQPYIEVVHDKQWLLGGFYGIALGLLFFSTVIFFALR